jgi:hypothetical protein
MDCLTLLLLFSIFLSSYGLKCLLISIDNRDLQTNLQSQHYPSLTAVINHAYAEYHGYDYLYIQNDIQDLITRVLKKYPHAQQDEMMFDKSKQHVLKDVATAFHIGLQQFRAASWARLPILWYLSWYFIEEKYDYIWYIDSDAVISPFFFHRTIEEAFQIWSQTLSTSIRLGQHMNLNQSLLIFFNNFPWRDDMPCAGTFFFQPLQTETLFRQWWDINLPIKNFKHFHEQDGMWHILDHGRNRTTFTYQQLFQQKYGLFRTFELNEETYSVVQEQQFPSSWTRYEEHLWITHIASYNYLIRMPILYQFLHKLSLNEPKLFQERIEHICQHHRLLLDPLVIAENMEIISQLTDTTTTTTTPNPSSGGSPPNPSESTIKPFLSHPLLIHAPTSLKYQSRIQDWPEHNEKQQHIWYDQHVTSSSQPTLPLSILYEGRLIRKKHEFWIVINGTRRPFQNYDSFVRLGLSEILAFPLNAQEINAIPEGLIPIDSKKLSIVESKMLTRYYEKLIPWKVHESHQHCAIRWQSKYHTSYPNSITLNHTSSSSSSSSSTPTPPSTITTGRSSSSTATTTCTPHPQLAEIIQSSTSGMKAIIYIIAHNNETYHISQQLITCLNASQYIQILMISSTVYFESYVYQQYFPKLIATWELSSYDYIITATYKTMTKTLHYNAYTQSLQQIYEYLVLAKSDHYDLIPFLRSGSEMMEFVNYWHGSQFPKAWDSLLLRMGYNISMIRAFDRVKFVFYRNIFIIKPTVLQSLTTFMQQAIRIVNTSPTIKLAFAVDANYKEGSMEVAQRIFGTNYYQLHPFIFERLPSFFIYTHHYKICMAATGPCKYNS